jgi:hypothetical protein
MAGERQLYWGPTIADAKYRTRDDDPQGGQFVVAEDTDNGTVLLRWDNVAQEWVYGGPVNMDGADLSNVGALDATSGSITNTLTAGTVDAETAIADVLDMDDAAADPSANGELQRNGADLKAYSGGQVRNLSNIGSGGGALTDSGTDNADGGDQYVLPAAADSVDLQSDGEVENAENVDTATADIGQVYTEMTLGTDFSVPSNSFTQIPLDTVDNEHPDVLVADTTNNEIQVQSDGVYQVILQILWASDGGWSTGDDARPILNINGVGDTFVRNPKVGTAEEHVQHVINDSFSSGDSIQLHADQNSGSSKTAENAQTRLSVARLG